MNKILTLCGFALAKISLDTFKNYLEHIRSSANEPHYFIKAHPRDILEGADLFTIEKINGEVVINSIDSESIAYIYDEEGSGIYTTVVFLDKVEATEEGTIHIATGKKNMRLDKIYCLANPDSKKQ
jgi:hypothetical protein